MTTSTYLQRLIGRMGITPATDAASTFTPPDVPAVPLYDPFVEAEMVDETIAPTSITPELPSALLPSALPALDETSEPPSFEIRERVVHEFTASPFAHLDTPEEVQPPTDDPMVVPTIVELAPEYELPLPVETIEQVVVQREFHDVIQPSEASSMMPPILPPQSDVLPPTVETVERVITTFTEVAQDSPPIMMEAPLEPETHPLPPLLEAAAPQITIGDIVVEIVTKSETGARASGQPAPRITRPVEAPAARTGVRSKRRFGLGQM